MVSGHPPGEAVHLLPVKPGTEQTHSREAGLPCLCICTYRKYLTKVQLSLSRDVSMPLEADKPMCPRLFQRCHDTLRNLLMRNPEICLHTKCLAWKTVMSRKENSSIVAKLSCFWEPRLPLWHPTFRSQLGGENPACVVWLGTRMGPLLGSTASSFSVWVWSTPSISSWSISVWLGNLCGPERGSLGNHKKHGRRCY
jgi:hypothetical protein